jgi:hypothetical protein
VAQLPIRPESRECLMRTNAMRVFRLPDTARGAKSAPLS